MPLLKDLNCSIELSDDQQPLRELGTVYGDAFVETFIPVPGKQQTFTIHLSSKNFIAPGIAMYVFIDGIYQCNRNRQDMKLRRPPDRRSLVDFKVRQKEERQKDGSMIAREWTFEKLDHASADGGPNSCSPNILENIGCIEVVVLRCAGTRTAKTAANMNMDGAADYPDYHFKHDGLSRMIAYDDRNPFVDADHTPLRSGTPYQPPYAETVRSRQYSQRAPSRYSEPVSPGTRPNRDIPAPGFQYGSGPLPPPARAASYRGMMGETVLDGRTPSATPAVDPTMLEKIVTDAVKRGVEESRKSGKSHEPSQVGGQHLDNATDRSSQVPGSWPTSPRRLSQHPSQASARSRHHDEDHGVGGYDSTLERLSKAKRRRSSRSRTKTRVAWDQEPEWDKQSMNDGWGSTNEKKDSWGVDDTSPEKRSDGSKDARRRSKSKSCSLRSTSPSRKLSRHTERISKHQRSSQGRSRKSTSRSNSFWKDDAISSSEGSDDWSLVDAPSDSSTSVEQSDSTLKPSHSRSQIHSTRSKSIRNRSGHERRLSQLFETPQWRSGSAHHAPPPSVLVTNAPTQMSVPISHYPSDVQSRKPSAFTQPAVSVAAPPPTWGCATEKPRKGSVATTFLPPAPFSTTGKHHRGSRQSSDSSSWGIADKERLDPRSERKTSQKDSSWGEDKQGDQAKSTWGDDGNNVADWSANQTTRWEGNTGPEQKDSGWENVEKGDGGWVASSDAKVDAWNTTNNDSWGQAGTKNEATGGWNIDNEGAWGQNDGDTAGFQNDTPWGGGQEANTTWDQLNNTIHDSEFKPETNIWAAAPPPPSHTANTPSKEQKSPSPSKRLTTRSLSKYRQHPTHRHFPPPPPPKTLHPTLPDTTSPHSHHLSIPSVPSDALHKIPSSIAKQKGVEHQVLAGPGTAYGHAVSRPKYLDSLEEPYAVFRFKYRSREVLRGMFGEGCLRSTGVVRREELEGLSKEELVRRMVGLQVKGDREGSVAGGRTEKWVREHSRAGSEAKGKGETKTAEKVGGAAKEFDLSKVNW